MSEDKTPPLKEKNPAAVELGRLGGLARAATGADTGFALMNERKAKRVQKAGVKAAQAWWAAMTPEERSAEMKRRMAGTSRTVRGPYRKRSAAKESK